MFFDSFIYFSSFCEWGEGVIVSAMKCRHSRKRGVEFWRVDSRAAYIEWLLRQHVIMVFFLSKIEMEQPRLNGVFDSVISFLNDVPLPWKLLSQRERKKARKLRRSVSPRRSVVRRWSTFCRLSPERGQLRVQTGLSRGNSMSNESGDATVVRLLCRGQYER